MIRSNLATRPFYDARGLNLWLLGLALVVALATVFNIVRVIQYSRSDTALATQAARDEGRAADARAEAARLRGTVDRQQIDLISTEARVANELIDRRTFSWTELFNQFEATFPADVRITSVRPQLDEKGMVRLTITVVGRSVDDIEMLITNLEGTGSFMRLLAVEDRISDNGMVAATLEGVYMPTQTRPGAKTQ